MRQIIMFEGGVETLDFFSIRLADALRKSGHPVYFFKLEDNSPQLPELISLLRRKHPVLLTFNFHGLRREAVFYDDDGRLIWNRYQIPCINIVVDHPFYYHKELLNRPDHYFQYCIDRFHLHYMKRFYPDIKCDFLPSGGTMFSPQPLPFSRRSMELVFTGNYSLPSAFDRHITRHGKEYEDFYRDIISDLISCPGIPIESVMETHMIREMGKLSDKELAEGMSCLIFIDLYVRFYFRGEIIRTLADHHIPIHIYGSGWEALQCSHPENLLLHGPRDSMGCLEAINAAKLSLNIMPYFKDGAHDRIFNSMLGGAVCLTDSSLFLEQEFHDGDSLFYFTLEKISSLPGLVSRLLAPQESAHLQQIAENAWKQAAKAHTWSSRAELLSLCAENLP